MVAPGTYTVRLLKRDDGQFEPLSEPRSFEVEPLQEPTLAPGDREARLAFQTKAARLQRAVMAINQVTERAAQQLDRIKQAVQNGPDVSLDLYERARALERRLDSLRVRLTGPTVKEAYNEPTPPAVLDRVQRVVGTFWGTTTPPQNASARLRDCLGAILYAARPVPDADRGGPPASRIGARGRAGTVDRRPWTSHLAGRVSLPSPPSASSREQSKRERSKRLPTGQALRSGRFRVRGGL